MKTNNLTVVHNEPEKTKRVLPEQKPKPLNPPVFEDATVDMYNPGVKWLFGIMKIERK